MRIQKLTLCFSLLILMLASLLPGCQSSDNKEKTELTDQTERQNYLVEMTAADTTDALKLLLKSHEVDYQSSLMGSFVTGIGGIENSSAGYWVYKVNDTTPKIACDKMILLPGDRLRWLFQSSDEPESTATE